ncbi:hypothetical protein ALO83_104145 [Pseudomonas cannabina pv. alisalensis]|uniref:Uncharacterized protein n=2 Tax=Pseudomonas cannabina TaxID=86840 RepID=A0A3M3QLI9_PSECA|nr:hypothetical protein [Pseudomonas cannabina]KPW26630.1 hypothetical protein ALO83_104145 [Pseudomonas cannabina pv. alisalensis]MBM0140171.1 hypothetical protein [Pseudomonas cannabina pv. alisalensis]RMN77584.1 hypothetical protein ALQ52_104896 [Pseudomonas cannabina pv. alisalensis]RMN85096.1 hypothetical protein ALQ53_103862 [Pseudomonas cannabina]RMO05634.1 hypothetical protein ALQ51_01731 [Pseudomonas cannabina]
MSKAKRAPFAMQAGLTLALSVSASFTHVAAAPTPALAVVEARKDSDFKDLQPSDKAKLRDDIKRAMVGLKNMNQFLANCCEVIVSGDHIPKQAIDDEPFTEIAATFRELEFAMADKWADFSEMPIISDEMNGLRKALATARSRAAQNSMLLKQRSTVLEPASSDVDMQGLQKLTAISSERLLRLAS